MISALSLSPLGWTISPPRMAWPPSALPKACRRARPCGQGFTPILSTPTLHDFEQILT